MRSEYFLNKYLSINVWKNCKICIEQKNNICVYNLFILQFRSRLKPLYIYIWHLNLINTVSADGLGPIQNGCSDIRKSHDTWSVDAFILSCRYSINPISNAHWSTYWSIDCGPENLASVPICCDHHSGVRSLMEYLMFCSTDHTGTHRPEIGEV